jgi:predicted metal-dependent hydrolase
MSSLTAVKNINIEGIGNVLFKISPDSRYLRLRVDQNEGIVLILPQGFPEQKAYQFLYQKKNWIQKSVLRQQKILGQNTVFKDATDFSTRMHRLYLAKHSKNTIKSVVTGDKIFIWYPDQAPAEHPKIQKAIRKAITEAWKVEAKKYIPHRVAELAQKFSFRYNQLTIKNAKTRWGSCSASDNINLNLQLMRLPDRLIDYVILHELVHTVHKNHKKDFWNAFENIFPGAKKADKELNKYHLQYW